MRSTPTTPYSDFIYLMEKALCNTGECRIYGEYNTIRGAYVEYVGKENLNYMFNYASSTWYSGSFGQTEPWEVCIVTADLNKEVNKDAPILFIDSFLHRRKFIVIIDNSIVNDCYFAGNSVKAYSDEEKFEKLCRIKYAIGAAMYGFIDRVIFTNYNNLPSEIRTNIISTISSYICSWYLYNFARASKKILREVDEDKFMKTYKDKVTPEELETVLDWYDKDMEYCKVFEGSFPDIDRVEGASFRYRIAFGISVIFDDEKQIDYSKDIQDNINSIKDTIKNINDVLGTDTTPESEEEKPAPKKRTTKKSTTSTKKTTTSRKSTKKEETVDDTKD